MHSIFRAACVSPVDKHVRTWDGRRRDLLDNCLPGFIGLPTVHEPLQEFRELSLLMRVQSLHY